MSDWDKDTEIPVVRHQVGVLERQLGRKKVRFAPSDRALLAALPESRLDILACLVGIGTW